MKKLFLLAAVAVLGFTVNAQETSFGATAGLTMLSPAGDLEGDSETGFHVGFLAEIGVSDTFAVQPELTYAMAGDVSMFSLNAMAKYYVAEEFNIHVGPVISLAGGDDIDAMDDFFGDDFSKLNLQLAFGLGYDFTEDFFAQARYGVQLNNHYTGDADGEIKINTLTVGIGYRF